MSQDIGLKNIRLDNMANIKKALNIETAANRDAFIREGIAGLEQQKQYWQSTPAQQEAYDEIERKTLSNADIPTSKNLNFTFSRAQWENSNGAQWENSKGGKLRRKSRKSRKSRRRRTNKKKRFIKRRY